MDIKGTAKRMGTAAAVATGTVAAATSGLLNDPAHPVQQALTAPDWKSAALAGGTAAVTAAVYGRHSALNEKQFGKK